jgi:hypothetical protein
MELTVACWKFWVLHCAGKAAEGIEIKACGLLLTCLRLLLP